MSVRNALSRTIISSPRNATRALPLRLLRPVQPKPQPLVPQHIRHKSDSLPLSERLFGGERPEAGADFAKDPIITYNELIPITEQPSDDVLLVDVREPDELQSGMIPSAVSLPLSELKEALEPKYHEGTFYKKFSFPKPTSAQNLIFYCRSGKRSAAAAEIATEKGYRSVRNYKGSWLDWSARSKARAEEEDDVDDTTGGYKN